MQAAAAGLTYTAKQQNMTLEKDFKVNTMSEICSKLIKVQETFISFKYLEALPYIAE